MSPDHPAMNAPAMDHELKSTQNVNDPHTAGNYYDESIRFDSMLGLKLGTGPGPPSAPSAPSAQGPSDVNSAAAGAADASADAPAGAALGEEGNINYGIKQEGIFTSPSILLDSFPISHPVEYTDDEDDAHEDEDEDDEDFVETAAQLSSVDGRFAEEGDCKQEGNGKQKWISTSPAVPINSHPIADGDDSDEEDAIAHAAAIAATAPTPSAAAAVPATPAAASIVENAVPNHEFKTTTSARGVPILVVRDRPGSSLYDVIIVFAAVGIPPTVDTFGTSGRVRGRLRCEESLQQ